MTVPSRGPRPVAYPAGPQPRAFAHRGWHVGELAGLENTAVAFERAVAEGYHYLETDVHLTADGVLVAFHDSSLDRVTGRPGRIADLPWREVQAARIGDREPIPLLADLLHDFPTACFNVDAKSDAAVVPLAEAIRGAGAEHRVCVASFSDRRLARLRAAIGPTVASSVGRRSVMQLMARSRRFPMPAGLAASECRSGAGQLVSGSGDDPRVRRRSPPSATSRCTSGPSTIPRRCTGCSTSASTAS